MASYQKSTVCITSSKQLGECFAAKKKEHLIILLPSQPISLTAMRTSDCNNYIRVKVSVEEGTLKARAGNE